MRKPPEEWITAVRRERRVELKPILEGMGEANLRKVLAFCAHVRDLRPGRRPKAPPKNIRGMIRALRTAEDIRSLGDEGLADQVTAAASRIATASTGESTIGYPFLFIGGGRGDSTDDLRKVYFVRVLEANFRWTFDGPRWEWTATLYGITFDVPNASVDTVRKLFERSRSRKVLEARPDLGLKK